MKASYIVLTTLQAIHVNVKNKGGLKNGKHKKGNKRLLLGRTRRTI